MRQKQQSKHTRYDQRDLAAIAQSQLLQGLDVSGRFDSAEDGSVFFARELDQIKAKTYDRLYPEMTALQLFPLSSELDPGAETATYYSYEKTGIAKIIANYADDLPRADVKGKPTTVPIRGVGNSYGYSIQEMRASVMSGKSLDVRKAESARYAVDATVNRIAWAGDESHGLQGVLSPGNDIPIFTLPVGASGSTKWAEKTPDEILYDVKSMTAYTAALTKRVERPNVLALPTDAFIHVFDTPRSPNSDTTIATYIVENFADIEEIVEVPELNADSGITPFAGQDVAFFFTRDANKLQIEIPAENNETPKKTTKK